MKFHQINEAFFTAYKIHNQIVEIFTDPSQHEIRKEFGDNKNQFKFIADSKAKKIYVWVAYLGFHTDVWEEIRKELHDARKDIYKSTDIIAGMYTPDMLYLSYEKDTFTEILKTDWQWVDKYFHLSEMLEQRKYTIWDDVK